EATPPLGLHRRSSGRVERTRQIAQPMLAELRDLDPRLDRDAARADREVQPRRHRLVVAAEPAEEPASLDYDPLFGPGRFEPSLGDAGPRRPVGPTADVGWPLRGPPRIGR